MKKESKNKLLYLIANSDIENTDKLELLINLRLFLKNYDENIKILSKQKTKRK